MDTGRLGRAGLAHFGLAYGHLRIQAVSILISYFLPRTLTSM